MQNTSITNQQGEKLAAIIFTPQAEPRLLVVVCHGFRGGKENGGRIFQFAERLNQLGIAVLAFDFSGSGESEGDFARITLSRQAADLKAVIDYACERFEVPVVLLGRSFGGSTVIAAGAGDKRIAAFILWSTPIFMEKTFAAMLPETYKMMQSGQIVVVKDGFGSFTMGPQLAADFADHDMNGYLQAVEQQPVLIIHAQDDELVAPENAVYMKDHLENVTFHLVAQAGHRFLEKIEVREDLTIAWLKKIFLINAEA